MPKHYHPDLIAHLTDRELRELTDWTYLNNRDSNAESFGAWLDSAWGDGTVRDWLNRRTGTKQGGLDDEKLSGRPRF